jgi:5,10-methenyltetrahydrofolate synthetase
MTDEENLDPSCYASPPCFMHELDPAFSGFVDLVDVQQRTDVMRWRKAERQRLIAERRAKGGDTRRDASRRIADALTDAIGEVRGLTVSAYWPIRGEPDLREWMAQVTARGGQCALPVVVKRGSPLVFRSWAPDERLERGFWNIPVPADGHEVMPDLVLAPVVGFDLACYRLGYGGGYFDRTLAALPRKPRLFGVGYAQAGIPTIYPQPHDIPMDAIVTETGILWAKPDGNGGEV